MPYDPFQLKVDVDAITASPTWSDEKTRRDLIRQVGIDAKSSLDAEAHKQLMDTLWQRAEPGLMAKAGRFVGTAVEEVAKSIPAVGGAAAFAVSDALGLTDTGSGTRLTQGVKGLIDTAGQRIKQFDPNDRQEQRDALLESLRADLDTGAVPQGFERWLSGEYDNKDIDDPDTKTFVDALVSSVSRAGVAADRMGDIDPEKLNAFMQSDRNPARADSDTPDEAGARQFLADYVATKDPQSWEAFKNRVTETDQQYENRMRTSTAQRREAAGALAAAPEGLAKEMITRSFSMQESPIDLASAALPVLRGAKALQAARAGGMASALKDVGLGMAKEGAQEAGTEYLQDPRATAAQIAEAGALGAVGSGVIEGGMAGAGALMRPRDLVTPTTPAEEAIVQTVEGSLPAPVVEAGFSPEMEAKLSAVEEALTPVAVSPVGTLTQKPGETGAEFISRLGTQAEELAKSLETAAVQTAAANADVLPATAAALAATAPAPAPVAKAPAASAPVDRASSPAPNLLPRATESAPPRPQRQGRDTATRDAWDEQYGDMRKGGRSHNDDGSPYQPTLLDEVMVDVREALYGATDEEKLASIGDQGDASASTTVMMLLNDGWVWDAKAKKLVNPANPAETPLQGVVRIRKQPAPPVQEAPTPAETLDQVRARLRQGLSAEERAEDEEILADVFAEERQRATAREDAQRRLRELDAERARLEQEIAAQETPVGALEAEASGVLLPEDAVVEDQSQNEPAPIVEEAVPPEQPVPAVKEAIAAQSSEEDNQKALLNDLQIAEEDYRVAEQKAQQAEDLFFTERDKYDSRKKKPRNYTYAGPKEHQDRILALANDAFKARQFANSVAQDLGKARKNATPAAPVVEDQFQKTENVVAPAGETEVGLGMEDELNARQTKQPMGESGGRSPDSGGHPELGIPTGEIHRERTTKERGPSDANASTGGSTKPLSDEDRQSQIETILSMIDFNKSSGKAIPVGWINRLAVLRGNPKPAEDEVYSNIVEGHPQYPARFKELEYLVPIKVKKSDDLQAKFDRAQAELDRVNKVLGEANYAVTKARTASEKKKAQAALQKLQKETEIQETLRDVILPELNRLDKALRANEASRPQTPATQAPTTESAGEAEVGLGMEEPAQTVERDVTKPEPEQMTPEEQAALKLSKRKGVEDRGDGIFFIPERLVTPEIRKAIKRGGRSVEFKPWADVTGVPSDRGYAVLDRRARQASRKPQPTTPPAQTAEVGLGMEEPKVKTTNPPLTLPWSGINPLDVTKEYGLPEDFYEMQSFSTQADPAGKRLEISRKYRTDELDAAIRNLESWAGSQSVNASAGKRLARQRLDSELARISKAARGKPEKVTGVKQAIREIAEKDFDAFFNGMRKTTSDFTPIEDVAANAVFDALDIPVEQRNPKRLASAVLTGGGVSTPKWVQDWYKLYGKGAKTWEHMVHKKAVQMSLDAGLPVSQEAIARYDLTQPQPTTPPTDATPPREIPENRVQERQAPDEGGTTPEASRGDLAEKGGAVEGEEVTVPETGKYSVYKSGNRWLIQQSDKRGFGDQIVDTREEAIAESLRQQDMERQNKEFYRKQEEKAAETQRQLEAKEKPLNDYLDALNLTAMQRGKLKMTLQENEGRRSQKTGKTYFGDREQVTREMVADGYAPTTEQVPAIKEPTGIQWNRMSEKEQRDYEKKKAAAGMKTEYRLNFGEGDSYFIVTKAEYDYAAWLKSEKPQQTPAETGGAVAEVAAQTTAERLRAATSRAEAQEIIGSATLEQLKTAAAELNYPATGTKKDVARRLVNAVGSRADAIAIKGSARVPNAPLVERTPEQQKAFQENLRQEKEAADAAQASAPKQVKPDRSQEAFNRSMEAIRSQEPAPPAKPAAEVGTGDAGVPAEPDAFFNPPPLSETVPLPRSEKIKIGPSAQQGFKARVKIAADEVSQIRAGYDGVGRLMEVALERGGIDEAIAFREWLLRQKDLSPEARRALLDFALPRAQADWLKPKDFGSTNKVFTKKAKDKAAKNIGGQVNLGGMLDPAILKDVVTVGGFYVEGGVRSFAEFSAKLIEEFGAGIQKYLRPAYDAIRKRTDIDTTGMDPEDGGETAPKAPTPAPKPKGDITLNPSEIEVIPEDMARAEADKAANNERWQKASVSTEPVSVLRRLDGTYKMIDGHHRLLGAMDRGETVEAKVTQEKKLEPLKKSATAGTALVTQDEPLPPLKDKIEVIHFSRKPLTLAEKEKGTEYGEGADSVFGFGLYAMEPQDQKNWEGMDRLVLGPYKNELVIQAEKPLVVSPDTISDLMQQAKKEGVSFDSPWPFHTWLRSQTEGGKHDTIVVRGFDLSGDKTKKLKDQIEVRIAELWKPVFAPGKTSGAFTNVDSYVQAIQQATQEIAGLSAEEFELISSLQNQVFVPPSKVGAVKPATKPLPTEPPPAEPPPPAAPAAGQPAPLEGPVSVANEPLNKVAEIIGLPRLETPLDGPYAWPQAWEDARAEFQQNPERGRELVSGMIARPRPPTPLEEVILLREGVTRTNAFNAAVDAQSKATEADQEDANRRVADATNALAELQQVSALMGTLSGRALNFRKMSAWMDFSLANMTTRLQGAKQKELTKEEIKDAQDTHKKITEIEKKIDETQASAGAEAELTSIFEETFKEAMALAKKNANDLILQSRSAAKQGKSMKDFLVEKREEARKRIRLRGNNLNMGLNPADLFDHAVIMASYIAEGVVSLADLTAKMISDFGPNVEKHIPQIKKEADALIAAEQQVFEAPEAGTTKTYAEQLVESQGENLSDRWVYNRVKEWLVEQGEAGLKKDTKVLLDEVFKVITKEVNAFDPNITEQQLRDMFSGYGKVKFPDPEAAAKKLRQMRRLELLLDKLERARAGVAPLRAGLQRDETTIEEREALKLLNQTMKDLDIPRAPSGANIKTPLDAVKSRLKNAIEDLNKQIKERKRAERPRKDVEYDEEAKALETQRDALQKQLDEIDPPRPPTVEERITARLKDLNKQIADLKTKVAAKDYKPKQNETPITEQIQVKSDERDALRQTLKEMRIEAEGLPVLTQEQVNERAQRTLARQIDELEKQIRGQDFAPKGGLKPEASPTLFRLKAKIEALRKQRDQLKEDLGFRRKQKTDSELIDSAVASLEKTIDRLNKQINEGDLAPKARPSKVPEVAKIKNLRAERDSLREEVQRLRKAKEDAAKDPVAEKIKADRKQLQRMIKSYEDRIAKGDFRKRPKIAKVYDDSLMQLEIDLDNIKAEWSKKVFEAHLASRPPLKRMIDTGGQVLNTSRAILTSFDLSAVLRQGGFIGLGNPFRAARNIIPMLQAFKSDDVAKASLKRLKQRDNWRNYVTAGLYIAETDQTKMSAQEEAFMSRWIDKIPSGAKGLFLGSVVRGSQRAYITFLNNLRADTFDALLNQLQKGPTPTREEMESIAYYINTATGRGDLGKGAINQGAVLLNTVFFAPRLVASRFQIIGGMPVFKATGRTKALVLQEYAKFLMGASIVYALAGLAQDDDDEPLELDPRSSDFLKVRYGDTRVDPLGGLIQATVFVSRVVAGETKSAKGKIVPIRDTFRLPNLFREVPRTDKVPYGGRNVFYVGVDFMRTKFSPAFGGFVDLTVGENVIGETVTPVDIAYKMTVPMSFDEAKETLESHGMPKGPALTVLMMFGAGVMTYNDRK